MATSSFSSSSFWWLTAFFILFFLFLFFPRLVAISLQSLTFWSRGLFLSESILPLPLSLRTLVMMVRALMDNPG